MGRKSRAKKDRMKAEALREGAATRGASAGGAGAERRIERRAAAGKFFRRPWVPVALIILTGLLVYSNTFSSPFQWDDRDFIGNNPILRDMGYFWEPSRASDHEVYMSLKNRYVGYLSFALNYQLHGLDVAGYHAVNIAIHVGAALMVWLLALVTFRSPLLRETGLAVHSKNIALFSALIFVAHPVQTEAVTYVFQRLASLAGLFYLTSVFAYARSRLSEGARGKYGFYALCLLAAVLAMKTKENTFTLPLAIVLYEFVFLGGIPGERTGRRLLRLVPVLLLLLIIPVTIIGVEKPIGEIVGGMKEIPRGSENVSRAEYLFTQSRVIVTYLRLLVLPVGQSIDHDVPVSHSFFEPAVAASSVFLLLLFGAGLYLIVRSRRVPGAGASGLLGFGLLWFFLTLSVESSIIPIPMLMNEYRVYLPGAWMIIAAAAGLYLLIGRIIAPKEKAAKTAAAVLTVIVVVFSGAAFARNSVWRTEIGLWEDLVQKSPSNTRGRINLGNHYKDAELYDKAAAQYEAALAQQPQNAEAHNNLGTIYWLWDMLDKAAERFETAIRIEPDYVDAHTNLGAVYWSRNDLKRALENYEAAVRLDPYNAPAYSNLGLVYYSKGDYDRAIEHYRTSLRLKPEQAETHNNLASALFSTGLTEESIKHYETAIELKPGYIEAHFNLGMLYFEKGDFKRSREMMSTALKLKPGLDQAQEFLEKLPEK